MKDDKNAQDQIKKRRALINNCYEPEIKQVSEQLGKIIEFACVANSGGWLIYIAPVILVALAGKRLFSHCTQLITAPTQLVSKAMKNNDHFNACA